jgi:hypothetical protein
MAGTLSMIASEVERARVVRQVSAGALSQSVAAERLGVGYSADEAVDAPVACVGDAGLISRKRGQKWSGFFEQCFALDKWNTCRLM